ncbi:hypothetical protein MSG28_003799 [Choristoneura fumiferana]|uniref:Uncharacterized protein n=1 Tax=Choristoneura fumiferana TaxID=7141 RepID=A0ACC0KG69_CHOFU|nr:hypothetical protein MSG28_003799 [Choristoneura fumiferana]
MERAAASRTLFLDIETQRVRAQDTVILRKTVEVERESLTQGIHRSPRRLLPHAAPSAATLAVKQPMPPQVERVYQSAQSTYIYLDDQMA